jgi:peptidyl-prolyl cis-trans isomerase D
MLRGIHKASSTWLGKWLMAGVMGLITISFAIWGIGDIFRGFGLNSAVKIGNTEISTDQFRQFYNDRVQQLSRRLGRALTPEQARALGLDQQALRQLIAETTLDEQAKALRLAVSDNDVITRITGDPAFRGPNGQFDHALFENAIREAGYSEARFIGEQRNVLLRREIAQSISGEVRVPLAAMTAVDQFQNEKRNIEYLLLGPAQAGNIPAPTPEVLDKYFEERKVLFRAPEYRKITLMPLSPADIAKPDQVSDADAKKFYDEHKSSYGTPERREVRQIVFPKPEEAAAARERIAKGASFADIVKERGLKDSDIDLGLVAKSGIINPAAADAAFSLKANEVSQPITSTFGTVLLQVGKIEPGNQKSYEDVAQSIKQGIAENRARTAMGELRDKFEDERAGGATLAEAANKLGIKIRTIDAVDRSGRGPDGKPVPDLPKTPDVVAAAFASDVGVDNDPLPMPAGGYLWFDIGGITPAHDRTLADVKSEVETHWRDDEIAKRLKAKADEMLGKLKSGTSMAQLATDNGLVMQTGTGLQRNTNAGFVPAKVIETAFRTPKGEAGSSDGAKPTEQAVFRVTEITEPKLDPASEQGKKIAAALQSSYADDIIGAYLGKLENDFGVTLNQAAVNQIIGAGSNN